jgi:DNA mismatch repair ATPase MutS
MDQVKIRIRQEEQTIFQHLRREVILNLVKIRRNAAVMDELDVGCSFAILAQEQQMVRPILNDGVCHKIVGGRHPTVKLGLEEQGRSFVSNDCFLGDSERIWLITGPNMAGKSTFLRQNALITILAQVGSFVPAAYAEIGIVDQIFSRIGAADDLFRDQSTFMVEMLETAAILKQATPKSFVIMDEVGRGTTPEDGTAVSFACLHHLHNHNQARTLFATHFHALADMTQDFEALARYCTDVKNTATGTFSFVHRLRKGVNRQSHALKVAQLAGLPKETLELATRVRQRMRDGTPPPQVPDEDQPALQGA